MSAGRSPLQVGPLQLPPLGAFLPAPLCFVVTQMQLHHDSAIIVVLLVESVAHMSVR